MPVKINPLTQMLERSPIARVRAIPQLHFDSSKSGIIRFFSPPVEIAMHYCDAGVPLPRLICPISIDISATCLGCKDKALNKSRRFVSVGWDCIKDQWCFLMFTNDVRESVARDVLKLMELTAFENGGGPDIILQRIGLKTDVSVLEETLGEIRGPKPPIRSGDETPPSVDALLLQLKTKSAWRKCANVAEIKERFSKSDEDRLDSVAGVPVPTFEASQPPLEAPRGARTPIGDDRWDFL